MAIIPIKNPRAAKASPILMIKATMVPRVLTGTRNPKVVAVNPIRMVKVTIVPKGAIIIAIRNPKAVEVNPTHMVKVTIVPKGAIIIATRNPKVVEVNPTHMVKAAMATRVVMENLMGTKKYQPIEVMEDMDRVLLSMSCIISTSWV